MLLVQLWGPEAPQRPRLALSLRRLGRDADARWPNRDRASDGWVGDAAHASRVSDHNPDAQGIVHAIDVDASGIDPWVLVVAAVLHPATAYVIHEGRIFSRSHSFIGRRYEGADDHHGHVHVSILHTHLAERSHRSWLHES